MGSSGSGSGKERSDVPYSRAEEDHAQETPKVKGFGSMGIPHTGRNRLDDCAFLPEFSMSLAVLAARLGGSGICNMAGRIRRPNGVNRDTLRISYHRRRAKYRKPGWDASRFDFSLIVLSNVLAIKLDTESCSILGQTPLHSEACASIRSSKQL
jgi:hypothetical protein